MSFISYAQNFEDVMLWRALKHVKKGVYVDVGAQHPVIDSVSKAFYENGWRGIHFEPVPYYAALLRQDRPDEVVMEVALADVEGTLELNVIAETGLSTAVNDYAQRHHDENGFESQKIQVPVLTLKSALHSLEGKAVHWLKIDVEGLEEKVLKGWDSRVLRPWVMVVEATIPNSPEVNYVNWEPMLIAADYQFVYFDGLNRFYVAKEHRKLVKAFSCPPNVFDDIDLGGSSYMCRGLIASHQAREAELAAERQSSESLAAQHSEWLQNEWNVSKQRIEELSKSTGRLETELASEEQKAGGLAAQLASEEQKAGGLAAQLAAEEQKACSLANQLTQANKQRIQQQAHAQWLQNEWNAEKVKNNELKQSQQHWQTLANAYNQERKALYASHSWRITRPLRLITTGFRMLFKALLTIPKAIWWLVKWPFKLILSALIRCTIKHPALKSGIGAWLKNYPSLFTHSLLFARARGINIDGKSPVIPIITTPQPQHAELQEPPEPLVVEKTPDLTNLTPRARRIYLDLKEAKVASNKENS